MGLALLPLVVSAVQLEVDVGSGWAPTSDHALIEMRVRDVGRHPVLLGLYSRDGWSHPGPAAAEVLFLPYRLSGSRSIGLAIGALVVNGVAIAGMAMIAARRGGLPILLATLLATGLVMRALGPEYLRDPWNCFVTVLPFGLLIFLVWAMTGGEAWALPAAAVTATYLAQSHVQFVALGFPLLAVGAAALAWRFVRAGPGEEASAKRRSLLRGAVLSTGLLALLWLPPVVEQLGDGKGNLSKTVEWFSRTDEGTSTLREGLRVVFGQFGLPPEWLAGHAENHPITVEPTLLWSAPAPVLLVPCVVAVAVLWRRRRDDALRLAALVGVALGVGVVGVARTIGTVYDYRLQWTWLLPMTAAVVVVWAGWELVSRSPAGARAFTGVGLAGLLVLTGVNTVDALGAEPPQETDTRVMAQLMPSVLDGLPEGDADVLVQMPTPASRRYGSGVLLQLERHGVAAKVDSDPGQLYGDSRVHRHTSALRATLTVAADEAVDDILDEGHRGKLIAYVGDESLDQRKRIQRELAAAQRRNEAAHERGELDDDELLQAQSRLRPPGRAVGVFLDLPPSRP